MAYHQLLREVFGFESLLPGQEQVIDSLLAGRSALAVFPTGGGKSLCYQLPALLFEGLTLVVSPLIALMKDQVDGLASQGVPAARLDSSVSLDEWKAVHQGLSDASLKILYVAPERLSNERFLHTLKRQKIALMAIDEAHCISEWGHNFRPDYLKLAKLAQELRAERVLGLTATATPEVAADIRQAFGIEERDHAQVSFHRPNLFLRATPTTPEERPQLLLRRVREAGGESAIVYVTRQRTAEELAELLSRHGLEAQAYHAGLSSELRDQIQDAFMAGRCPRVVATVAFGMGIDKADIRAVFHYNIPKSLENYQQEVGRAGRDGAPSHCELLACAQDTVTLSNFTYGDTPVAMSLRALVRDLLGRGRRFSVSRYRLASRYDIRRLVVATVLAYLELDGVIRATAPFYTGYQWEHLRPVSHTLGRFDPERARFLAAVFNAARKGRRWHHIETDEVALKIAQPRERIVAALGFLEELGDLRLKASGLRFGYELVAPPEDVATLCDDLVQRFQQREQRDVERLNKVLQLAEAPGCLTQHLMAYFGEELATQCGHCGRCAGDEVLPVPRPDPFEPDERTLEPLRALIAESHDALTHPRQLTRFLCGLNSPATTKAKLRKDPRFGMLASVPFPDVLAVAEEALKVAR